MYGLKSTTTGFGVAVFLFRVVLLPVFHLLHLREVIMEREFTTSFAFLAFSECTSP